MKHLIASIAFFLSLCANATPTLVGTFNTSDGPKWWDNPVVYSGTEAAALIFGGASSDYFISTKADSITHTAWYDGWGEHDGMEFDENYKLDLGAPGYNDPAGTGTARSAYVYDGFSGLNYVWTSDAKNDVPEPGTLVLMGLGLFGAAAVRRRKQ